MPRGKLHYEQHWDEDGCLVETCKDSHGQQYIEVSNPDTFEDDGDNGEYYDDWLSDPYDD